jgi:hypothetical protein
MEDLESRKYAMITGFWANDGMNDDKGTRQQALTQLEEQFDEAKKLVYAGASQPEDVLTEEDAENPFLAPAIKATREIETPRNDEGTVAEAITSQDIDELDQA